MNEPGVAISRGTGSLHGRCLPGFGNAPAARPARDEWLSPPSILRTLGDFDLDPCSPAQPPWRIAARFLTVEDDGLQASWAGRVWLNPPYSQAGRWVARLAEHNHGTALVFVRSDTQWWQRFVLARASALLLLAGRVTFCHGDGTPSRRGHSSGGPSALVAYGPADAAILASCGLPGGFVTVGHVTG